MTDILEKIEAAIEAQEALGASDGTMLTDEELDFLAAKWASRTSYIASVADTDMCTFEDSVLKLVNFKSISNACGCMGAVDGEPWCSCTIWDKMESGRFYVARRILSSHAA